MKVCLLLLCATILPAATLPANAYATAIQIDSSGNLYIAGYTFPSGSPTTAHAFVSKLSPDGSQTIWSTPLAGSQDDRISGLAIGPGNSVFVTGTTQSTDFPTTKGTFANAGHGFAAKLDTNGAVVYSTFIPATSGQAVAVDSSGDAFLSGNLLSTDALAATPGSVTGGSQSTYILELDPTGTRALLTIVGFGGQIALDPQSNIYAASYSKVATAPTTSGAFQSSVTVQDCAVFVVGIVPCGYQYLAKIDATGSKLIYATYLAGTWGAYPAALAIDSTGNAIVAGYTSSPDYPTTPAAYQPIYFANPSTQVDGLSISAPVSSGFVTKLNATGTGLVWSTFLGGSGVAAGSGSTGDLIQGMAIDPSGNILLAGTDASTDFPGLWEVPVASRPVGSNPGHPAGFTARLGPDGGLLSPVQLGSIQTAIAARSDGTAVVAGTVVNTVTFGSLGRVTMIADPADNAKVVSVAPGMLLTVYGSNLAPLGQPPSGSSYPTSFNGVTVTFNGMAASILYTAGNQINLEVPYGIAGLTEVTMQVSSVSVSPAVSESFILAVAARQPSAFAGAAAFTAPLFDIAQCAGQTVAGIQALALNADGTLNTCDNPATAGSTVTVFLNGLGVTNPAQPTGAISQSNTALDLTAEIGTPGVPQPTYTYAGLIADVAQVRFPAPAVSSSIALAVKASSGVTTLVRGPGVIVWVKAQ